MRSLCRRDFLALSAAWTVASALGAEVAPAVRLRSKKGLAINAKNCGEHPAAVAQLRPSWNYNWGQERSAALPADCDFTPMIWGASANEVKIAEKIRRAATGGETELLGFNEPDGKDQANISVERALEVWPVLMRSGLRLGSPACVHPDKEWMRDFMKGVQRLKLRVDFVCMHNYGGPNPDALVAQVRETAKAYGRPVWLTEFAVADWSAKMPGENRHAPGQVAEFMRKVFPRLEEMSVLERHAWFFARPESGPLGTSSLVGADGKLTALGELYRKF
jgi:hypothetical protein